MYICVCVGGGGGGGGYIYLRKTILYRSNRLSIVFESIDFVCYLPIGGGGGGGEEYSGDLVDCLVRHSKKNPVHQQLRRLLGEVLFLFICIFMGVFVCTYVCMHVTSKLIHIHVTSKLIRPFRPHEANTLYIFLRPDFFVYIRELT